MIDGFQRVLDQIRAIADTEAEKGRLFERLMRTFFQQDPLYRQRFSKVWLWSEWAATRSDFDSGDSGIISAFRRIVHLSVQTVTVLNNLPNPFPHPEPNGEQQ